MKNIRIAIASNINFYNKTLEPLINSLLGAGIEKKDIVVFIAGSEEVKEEIIDNILFRFLNHNSLEYSCLVDIVESGLESDYWFLIHDTCVVGKEFKNKITNFPTGIEKMAIKEWPSMSMGLYKHDFLLKNKDKILSIKNLDLSKESVLRWKAWGVGNEDFLMWKTDPKPLVYNNDNRWWVTNYENWYEKETTRRTEYYPSVDLYKSKSNWGQTPINNMVISL